MISNKINPAEFPMCEGIIDRINHQFINNGWITLYDETFVYAVLISNNQLKEAKIRDSWELNMDNSHPTIEFENQEVVYKYHKDGIVPIITYQPQKGTDPKRIRLSDEFVLFYDLRDDVINNENIKYYIIDECGDKDYIAEIKQNQVLVQAKYIKEFIAVKDMSLLIQFDTMRYSNKSLKDNGYTEIKFQIYTNDEYVFNYCLMDTKENRSFACIEGKIWVEPDKKNIEKLWNKQDDHKETFIIGVDDNGDNIEKTCDESLLPNLFTRKGEEPYTLTPVFFKKEVLSKYYEVPGKYSINEGYIKASEWWLRIDNDRTDNYVVAVLADLGKIPYKEQRHWRNYNIAPPIGVSISETTRKRWFEGKSCDTTNAPDHLFKLQLAKTNDNWKQKYGWELFMPLAEKDRHHLTALHTMSERNNNDKEFDGLILSITKIVIDSLNEKEIIKATVLNDNVEAFLKSRKYQTLKELKSGIDRFEAFLISKGQSDCDIITQFRDIQKLRSKTVAHRKSSKPDKEQQDLFIRLELDKLTQQEAFNKILLRLVNNLKSLNSY